MNIKTDKMKIFKLLLALAIIFTSCQKESIDFEVHSITDLTSNFEGDLQFRSQLRLAFGKTVANALVHPEFRRYIKRSSIVDGANEFKCFREIVFALRKDDQVTDELNLKEILNAAVDEEVQELFGDDFLDLVLKNDPLITIKLPDFFYSFRWDTQDVIPMVSVQTPFYFSAPETGFSSYLSYHYTGYSELLTPKRASDYFSLVIKYSEDYLLWEEFANTTEKGISLFEILPQAENCWDKIEPLLDEVTTEAPNHFDMKYLKKRDLFSIFQQVCEPDFVATEPCGNENIWDCPNAENATIFIESLEFNPIVHGSSSILESLIYQDGMQLAIPLSNGNSRNRHFTKNMAIIGYRKCEFIDFTTEFTLDERKFHYGNLGEVILPKLNFDHLAYIDNPRIKKDVNVHLSTGWPITTDEVLELNTNVMFYLDEVNSNVIPGLFDRGWWITNSSYDRYLGNVFIIPQENPGIEKQSGNVISIYLKF